MRYKCSLVVVSLEFPTLLKLLPATEASCHLSSEQLGSISEALWASSSMSMPATHPRQEDTLWHVTFTQLSAYLMHSWGRMEETCVQFLCHLPPSCSVLLYACQLTLLQLYCCKMGTALLSLRQLGYKPTPGSGTSVIASGGMAGYISRWVLAESDIGNCVPKYLFQM